MEQDQSGLDFKSLLLVLAVFFICTLLIFPKIYLANGIYYKSLEIEKQKDMALVLEDENYRLRQDLEKIRFAHGIKTAP